MSRRCVVADEGRQGALAVDADPRDSTASAELADALNILAARISLHDLGKLSYTGKEEMV